MFVSAARVLLTTGLIGLIPACMSVPVTSLPRLAAMNPVSMDANQIEVAVVRALVECSVVVDVSQSGGSSHNCHRQHEYGLLHLWESLFFFFFFFSIEST